MNRAERVLETLGTATFWLYKPCIIWPFNLHSDLLDMELPLWCLLNMSPDFCLLGELFHPGWIFFLLLHTSSLLLFLLFFALQSASFPYLNPPFFHLLEFIAVFLSSAFLKVQPFLVYMYLKYNYFFHVSNKILENLSN